MQLVIDTNQASLLPGGGGRCLAVSLSPYVLSEILLRTDPEPTLRLLRSYDVRLGLTTPDVMRQLAGLSPQEIRAFEPFPVPGRMYGQDYELMREVLYVVKPLHLGWARRVKDEHFRYCGSLIEMAKRFRTHLRERGKASQKFASFGEALLALSSSPDSFLGSVILGSITDGWNRPTQIPPDQLFLAALSNEHLARLFKAQLAYYLCISRLWKDQGLNFDPSADRDDMTDITLPLYAADGDLIVTNDAKLTLIISLIESERKVRTSRADSIP